MFIVWGTKKVVRGLGYVAEYCPNCTDVRVVKVSRVGMVRHIYYVPSGPERLLGFVGQCRHCEGEFNVEPTNYAALETDKKASLETMVMRTDPKLQSETTQGGEAWGRFVQLRDPFLRLGRSLEDRLTDDPKLDRVSVVALIALLGVPLLLAVAAGALPSGHDLAGRLSGAAVVVFFVGLFVFQLIYRGEPKRFFRRRLWPELVRALQPLKPRLDELQSCLARLRQFGYRIAGYVDAEALLDALARPLPAPAPAPARASAPAASARVVKAPPSVGETAPAPQARPARVAMPDARPAARTKPAVGPAQKYVLKLALGAHERTYTAADSEILIGRHRGADIILKSIHVSRRHAHLTWGADGAPVLENLSPLGTSVLVDGDTTPTVCTNAFRLEGRGTIALASVYADAASTGDVITYRVTAS